MTPETTTPQRTTYIAILRHRKPFRRLAQANLAFHFGDSVFLLALSWLALELSGSALALSSVVAVSFLPSIIFGLWAGVLADRGSRKTTMAVSRGLQALVTMFIPLQAYFGVLTVIHLAIVAFLRNAIAEFFIPSHQAIIPTLVSEDELVTANSLSASVGQLALIAGPLAGGWLMSTMGSSNVFWIDIVASAASAWLIWSLNVEEDSPRWSRNKQRGFRNVINELYAGLKYVWSNRVVRALTVSSAIAIFSFGPFRILVPVYVQDILAMGPEAFGMINSIAFGGMLVGTLVVGHLGHQVPRGVIYAVGYILMGIMTLSLGVSSGLLFGLLMIALRSASNPFIFVANSTIVQTAVPDEYRGRVVGLNAALPETGRPLAVVLGGWIADTMGVTSAFLVSGLLFLIAALVALSSKDLRTV